MSPANQKARPRKPQYTVPESLPQQNDIPSESTNTVILKTVMELKESFGSVRQDLDHLKVEVDGIKKGQQTTERLSKILAVVLTVVTAIWAVVLYVVANWENIKTLLKAAVNQI